MPTYSYKARDKMGQLVKGAMAAENKGDLIDKLSALGYMTTHISEARSADAVKFILGGKKIRTEDMIMFYVQFSNMIDAGVPILNSLHILSQQTDNKRLKSTIGSVARSVESGDSFSEALAKYPEVFPNLFIHLAKAGEASGKLDVLTAKYGQYFEQQLDLRQKIKGALFYPMILFSCGMAVILFLVTFIIPQFSRMFIQSGVKLPAITQSLYQFGIIIKKTWFLWIIFFIACRFLLRRYLSTMNGRLNFDKFKAKVPVIGDILKKAALSRFARTLGILTGSGVPILQALDMTKEVVEDEVLGGVISKMRDSVERGSKLSDHLKTSGGVPPDTIQMIAVGEETGNLEGMLDKVADFYDVSIGYTVKKLTTMIEPLFLVVMGGLIGFIMASMLIPMFDMVNVMNR